MTHDLGGFSIPGSTVTTMLVIFAIYSLVILGLGVYVKIQSKRNANDSLASFLTGGGGLGAFAIAMIAATNSMAGGTMVTAPGLTYAIGFSGALIYYGGFLTAAYGIGSVGRKTAILRARTNAVSYLQLLRLRFQSKGVVGALAITGALSLAFVSCGQITSGAKVFAAVTGSNSYYLGLILVMVITVIYTLTGGVKSLAKVAVIQGVVMLSATFSIIGILIFRNVQTYGSVENAVRYLGTMAPETLQASTAFSPLNAMGTAIFMGIGLCAMPSALSVSMTYDNAHNLKRGVIISCLIFTIVQGVMCFTGPLVRLVNPDLVTRDYTTIYVASNLLPSWLGGIIFCGCFAAIQSSIAGYCISAATHLAKDFIVDCCNPKMTEKKQNRITLICVIGIAAVATIMSIWPTELTQYMINFAVGSICASWYWPALLGLYWKKATRSGMIASAVGGFSSYIVFYFLSSILPTTKAWRAANLGNINAFIPAWLLALVLLVVFSKVKEKSEKVPLGIFQVFFCDDYDESYAVIEQ